MSVREHRSKPGHFIVDCRPNGYKGKRERHVLECSREEAIAVERSYMRRHVEQPRPTARIMSGIFPAYLAYFLANKSARTAKDIKSCWDNWLRPTFGRLQPKVLTRELIEMYKSARIATGVKHRTVHKELSYFSGFLKWAAEHDYCEPIPFKITGFSKKLTTSPKPRPLTPEQIGQILERIEPQYRLLYLLMADAGMRVEEALTLQRSHIEFEHGLIYFYGKGNKERIVPITTDRLLAELEARRNVDGWLSVNPQTKRPYTSIKKALERAARKAGIEKHVYHHLLRHSFGTNATVAHYDLSALQSIMGHSSPMTTMKYQNLAGEYLRHQGRKMNDLVKLTCPHGDPGQTEEKPENKGPEKDK